MQFWREQLRAVDSMNQTLTELKSHPLPLARIKKIMKSDEDVRMISSEAPVLFAKACELFILELTHRAWAFSEANKRRTLQQSDLTAAIINHEHDVFEFLVRVIVPPRILAAVHKPPSSMLLWLCKAALQRIGIHLQLLRLEAMA
jgi:nuclear transcription factor Y, gamma